MKKFNHIIAFATILAATALSGCGEIEEKSELAKNLEGVWETVYFHADEAVYEYKTDNGWTQYTEPGESYPISRTDEDYQVLKFVNGSVSFVASNDPDQEDAVSTGMKFPYQLKGDRISCIIFRPDTNEGYAAIENMTGDTFKLVLVEKGYDTESMGYEVDRRTIHERDVTTFKRIK